MSASNFRLKKKEKQKVSKSYNHQKNCFNGILNVYECSLGLTAIHKLQWLVSKEILHNIVKGNTVKSLKQTGSQRSKLTEHTLLKQARTLGTPSLGPSMPGMKSILGPIQLNGLTIVKSIPFSAPSAGKELRLRRTAVSKY